MKDFFNIFTKTEKVFLVMFFLWILMLDPKDMSILTVINCFLLPITLIRLANKYI